MRLALVAAALRCRAPFPEPPADGRTYFLDAPEVLPAAGFCHQFHGQAACCSSEYALAVEAEVRGLQRKAAAVHGPCVDRLFRLYTGAACALCAPKWQDYAVVEDHAWVLRVTEENCDFLWDGCGPLLPHMTHDAFCGEVARLGAQGFFDALAAPTGGQTFESAAGNESVVYHPKHALHSHRVRRAPIARVVHERKRLALVQAPVLRGRALNEPRTLAQAYRAPRRAGAAAAQEPDAELVSADEPAEAEGEAEEPSAAEADSAAEEPAEAEAADAADAEPGEAADAEADVEAAPDADADDANATAASAANHTDEDLERVAELEAELARRRANRSNSSNATRNATVSCRLPVPKIQFAADAQLSAVDEGDFAGYDWPADPPAAASACVALLVAALA